jgi:transposase InsO family protein
VFFAERHSVRTCDRSIVPLDQWAWRTALPALGQWTGVRQSRRIALAARDKDRNGAEQWRIHYNEVRPHSTLGYLTPMQFNQLSQSEGDSK